MKKQYRLSANFYLAAFFTFFLITVLPIKIFAQGWIIPESPPHIQESVNFVLENQRIEVKLVEQVASYLVTQDFYNRGNSRIEGVFYFPLPKGSQITDFTYEVNGKKRKGELLEKEKARKFYMKMVNRMRDPALLEFMHQDLFRASIFPVPAGEKCSIQLKFTQILPRQDPFYLLDYPLFQKRIGRSIKPFAADAGLTIHATLNSEKGIQQIYSPSHQVDIIHKDQQHAEISFEGKIRKVANNRLQLFYQLGADEVGLSLLSYRKENEDGFFLLIASPAFNPDMQQQQPKDLLFVLDVSGSMGENNKIVQAKEALLYCLNRLNPEDRFNVIPFSTVPTPFRDSLQPVGMREEAADFIRNLEAKGGTNIYDALSVALRQNQNPERLFTIIFLTDGLPTVGIQDENEIVQKLAGLNRNNVRIFSFGVGYDVNTYLIDQIAAETNAVADYVKPDENIETVVSLFYEKIASPVLTGISLNWQDVNVKEVYPRKIPDLFKGGEITVLGRYSSPGSGEVVLTGVRENESFQYAAHIELSPDNVENSFIPTLWAARKIGFLLGEIRRNGENKELKDEVVRLSKQYGIVTPYTSYLAQADEAIVSLPRHPVPPGRMYRYIPLGKNNNQAANRSADAFLSVTGRGAVEASEMVQGLKMQDVVNRIQNENIRIVKGRTFVFADDFWREKDAPQSLPVLHIKYGSTAYFALLELEPELLPILTLGDKIEFSLANHLILIDDKGESGWTKQQLKKKLNL